MLLFFSHFSDFLVKVRAQVMTRDESTEGWLPLAGGGLANVSIRKRARLPPDVGGHEYIIYGQRISDHTVSFNYMVFCHSKNRNLRLFIFVLYFQLDNIELCYQSRPSIQQGDANISSLACWKATQWSNVSNSGRCKGVWQRHYSSLWWTNRWFVWKLSVSNEYTCMHMWYILMHKIHSDSVTMRSFFRFKYDKLIRLAKNE